MRGPDGVTSASIEGIRLTIVDGVVEVTPAQAAILASHGFVPWQDVAVPVLTDLVSGKAKKKGSLL